MRILINNWRDPTHPWAGGAEVYLYEIARRWVRQGHQVTWFCGRFPSQPENGWLDGIEIIRRGGIYSVYLQALFYYLRSAGARADVIFDSANGIPFFTPLYSRKPKVLLVHHIHRQVFFRELPPYLSYPAYFMERYLMPPLYRRSQVVTVSESSRRELLQLGVPASQISLVYNGVDHACYRPGAKDPRPRLVFLGRLRNYKSVDVALHAMPALLQAIPDLRFMIIGSGESEAGLKELSLKLGVQGQVQFLGHISQAACIDWLQRAHVVVNPSFKEGWGLTVIEANACGSVVVGSDVPGLRDSIQDGRTGFLFPYGDADALAGQVLRLLCDQELRRRMEQNALAWAARFNWDQTACDCLELLNASCLEKRSFAL